MVYVKVFNVTTNDCRVRKLVSAYQREGKKEELRQAAKVYIEFAFFTRVVDPDSESGSRGKKMTGKIMHFFSTFLAIFIT
jgi:hypothetical protein